MIYDCIIIGTGAAGVSAALTLKALKRDFLLIGSKELSLKIRSAEKIKNYPGLADVSGGELGKAFSGQLAAEGIEITRGKVNAVYTDAEGFGVACGQDFYRAKTVVFAGGVEAVKPIKGEREYLGKGVSYCAVCDGFLYRGRTIAAVVSSKDEEEEVKFLSGFASKIYMFAAYKNAGKIAENVEVITAVPTVICGDERVHSIEFGGKKVQVDGVFMLKQSVAGETLLQGLETKDGSIVVDRSCATNVAGAFAAGDCTGRPYQYAKAVGEGNVAAHSVNNYLNSKR